MTVTTELTFLKGIGLAVAQKFAVLNLKTVGDLINNFPRRYEDYSVVSRIADMQPGPVTIKATIKQATARYVRRGMHVTDAVAHDESGSVRIIWFNQPYRATAMQPGKEFYISGIFELSHQRLGITNPTAEPVSDFPLSTARIVPVYRETKGLTSRQIRAGVQQSLELIRAIPETLPVWLVESQQFVSRASAIEKMHFPASMRDLEIARNRLGFEEVFVLTLAALRNKYQMQSESALPVTFDNVLAQKFVSNLPYELTATQRRVCWQVFQDMQKAQPMNRLVEGDVGSGKTVVAAMAAAMVLQSGYQVALMAPTELLARQHAESISKLMKPLGFDNQVGLLVGGLSVLQKRTAHKHIASGDIRFIVGTHALIQDEVDMSHLELVIIDEQHRFGVGQRKSLQIKAGHMPHVLSMTATPIPRSLALTLYGELDISIIDEKPPGRREIITKIASPNSRAQLYTDIDAELADGRQMFVVCSLIAESETMAAASAEEVYKKLSTKDFKHRNVGLLHGKMKPGEKNDIMQLFVEHKLDILVSTTVVEVGVDVQNASIMLIEGAERFGLAQMHQLRGRVGRGKHQGYCYLMTTDSGAPSRRLRALESSTDGFKLAELDLQLRGPGAIYGTLQHGELDLRVASLTDSKLIAGARAAAQLFIDKQEDLLQYEYLNSQVTRLSAITNLN